MMPDFARRGRDRSSRRASRRSFGACLSTSRRMRSTCRQYCQLLMCMNSQRSPSTHLLVLFGGQQKEAGGEIAEWVSGPGFEGLRPALEREKVDLHRTLSATLAGTGFAEPRLPFLRRRSTTQMMKPSLSAARSRCWKSAGTRPGRLTLATWYQYSAPGVRLAPCRYRRSRA